MNLPTLPHPRHEPIFNLPSVVVWTVGLLVVIHLIRLALGVEADLDVLAGLAVVPARFALELGWFDQNAIVEQITAGLAGDQAMQRLAVARYFLDGAGPRWWSLLSYGLLHAGTAHIVMNCVWLTVFGSPVARRLGPGAFLVLLIAGTIAGAAAHIVIHAADVVPLVGASAGVSAATGAAARFVFAGRFGRDVLGDDSLVRLLPALSLAGIVRHRTTMIFIIIWFASNWLFGAGVVAFGEEDQSIAWEAHVGGFIAGLLLFPFLDRHGAQGANLSSQAGG